MPTVKIRNVEAPPDENRNLKKKFLERFFVAPGGKIPMRPADYQTVAFLFTSQVKRNMEGASIS